MDGDFFVGACVSTVLTKLALRYVDVTQEEKKQNRFLAESMLMMATIVHFGKSGMAKKVG